MDRGGRRTHWRLRRQRSPSGLLQPKRTIIDGMKGVIRGSEFTISWQRLLKRVGGIREGELCIGGSAIARVFYGGAGLLLVGAGGGADTRRRYR